MSRKVTNESQVKEVSTKSPNKKKHRYIIPTIYRQENFPQTTATSLPQTLLLHGKLVKSIPPANSNIESLLERNFTDRYGISHEEMIELKAPLYQRPDVEKEERKIESRRRTKSLSNNLMLSQYPIRRSRSSTAIVTDMVPSMGDTRQHQETEIDILVTESRAKTLKKTMSRRLPQSVNREVIEESEAGSVARYLQEGIQLRKSGLLEQSINHFSTIVQSDLPIVKYHLAISHFSAGEYNIADNLLTSAIEADSKDWRIYRMRGEVRLILDTPIEAKSDFENSFKIHPSSSCALKLALIENKNDNTATAMNYLNLSLEINPNNMEAQLTKGKCLSQSS